VWVALDTNSSSNWSQSDRVDCAVGISGAYQFNDRTPEDYPGDSDPLPNFVTSIENYTFTTEPQEQLDLSPVSLVTTPSEQNPFKPLFLANSIHDFMPYHQIVDMICALEDHTVPASDYQTLTISGHDHSFAIWFDWDEIPPGGSLPNKTVGGDIVEFLDANLK
jgi:hypothetical protein